MREFRVEAYIEPLTPRRSNRAAPARRRRSAATTVPAPSLPHGIGCPTRAAFMAMAAGLNVPTSAPSTEANDSGSAPAMSMPRSDGLMGAASTATTTSSGPGSGIGSVSIAMRTVPSSSRSNARCGRCRSSRAPHSGPSSSHRRARNRKQRTAVAPRSDGRSSAGSESGGRRPATRCRAEVSPCGTGPRR